MQQGFAADGSIKTVAVGRRRDSKYVSFARRFGDITIAAKLAARSLHAGIVVMAESSRARSRVPMN
jgi:hypothetical protein